MTTGFRHSLTGLEESRFDGEGLVCGDTEVD